MDYISIAIFLIQEGIKLEPGIAAAVQNIFSKGIPTPQDWADLRASMLTPFSALAPNSEAQIDAAAAAPASSPPAPPPAPAAQAPVAPLAPTIPAAHPPDIGGNPVL